MNLKAKCVTILLCIFVTLGVLVHYLQNYQRQLLEEHELVLILEEVKQVKGRLEKIFEQAEKDLRLWSNIPLNEDQIIDSNQMLQYFLDSSPYYLKVALINKDGIAEFIYEKDSTQVIEKLEYLHYSKDPYFLKAQGFTRRTSSALYTHEKFYTDAKGNINSDLKVFRVLLPRFNAEGVFEGCLDLTVDYASILLNEFHAEYFNMLVHNEDGRRVFSNIKGTIPTLEESEFVKFDTEQQVIVVVDEVHFGELEGNQRVWRVVLVSPIDRLLDSMNRAEYNFYVAGGLVAFIITIMGLMFFGGSYRGICQLDVSAKIYEKNKLLQEVHVASSDEIHEFAKTYNSLLKYIDSENDRLEGEVEHRTIEVSKSNATFSAIVESIRDTVILLNADGTIRQMNRSGFMIFGYNSVEIDNANITVLFDKETAKKWNSLFLNGSDSHFDPLGGPVHATCVRKDRSEFPVLVVASEIEVHELKLYTVIIYDITAQAKHEKEIIAVKNEAERANHAKSDFLANMSHELRTPMNAIVGMSDFLASSSLDDEQREFVEILQTASAQMLQLVNDVLDISKIEANQLSIELIPFDLLTLLEEIGDVFTQKLSEREGMELIIDYDFGLPRYLIGDPSRIYQVITNYVSNAIKFSNEGAVVIRVGGVVVDNKLDVKISVIDTGIGINSDKVEYLFDRFSQEDESSTREFGGAGLGLAICKEIADLMGGSVGARARKYKGSVFWFQCMLDLDPQKESDQNTKMDLTGVRVLIVEDNEMNQSVIEKQVSSWGIRNGRFSNGEDALHAMRQAYENKDPYQIALLDYTMPGMDGLELGKAIKADPHLRSTQMVMLKPVGRRGDGQVFSEAGFSGYLTKPIHYSQLHDILITIWSQFQKSGIEKGLVTKHTLLEKEKKEKPGISEEQLEKLKGIHVLLVEDNIFNLKVAKRILSNFGCMITTAGNGFEAIEQVNLKEPDFIFMDLHMPEMGGIEATKRIRETNTKVPIVALIANVLPEDKADCMKVGMNDFLAKPIKQDRLLKSLLHILK